MSHTSQIIVFADKLMTNENTARRWIFQGLDNFSCFMMVCHQPFFHCWPPTPNYTKSMSHLVSKAYNLDIIYCPIEEIFLWVNLYQYIQDISGKYWSDLSCVDCWVNNVHPIGRWSWKIQFKTFLPRSTALIAHDWQALLMYNKGFHGTWKYTFFLLVQLVNRFLNCQMGGGGHFQSKKNNLTLFDKKSSIL